MKIDSRKHCSRWRYVSMLPLIPPLIYSIECSLQAVRQTPNQILKSYSFSMSDVASSKAALDAACQPHGGRSPDAMFLCAGKSTPGFFVEENERTLREGMDNGYWAQAFSALVSYPHYSALHSRTHPCFRPALSEWSPTALVAKSSWYHLCSAICPLLAIQHMLLRNMP